MTFRFGKLKIENVSLFKFVVHTIYYRLGGLRVSEEQETLVGYASETQEVYVDGTRSGCSDFHEEFAGRHAFPLETAENRLDLHIYVDRSSIEVFFNHGQVVITDLIFPDAESKGLEIFTADEQITLFSLELYALK